MGRSKCIEWEYLSQVKALGKGQYTCKCKFCPHQWDGGSLRIRTHLLGLIGHGVVACKEVPKEIQDRVRKMHLHAKASSSTTSAIRDRDALGDALIDDMDDSIPTGGSSMGSGDSIHVQECDVSCKKRKASMPMGQLNAAMKNHERKQARIALRRFFYAEDIPHWKVRSPYFLDMVRAIGRVGSSFVLPTYAELRKSELMEEVKQVDRDLMGVREQWEKYGCTIVSDGWSHTRNRLVINFMEISIHGAVFLKSVDTSGHVKSGDFILQHLKKVILDVGPTNVVQVCMDNAANCIRAGEMVEKEWPTIMFTRCACHCLDLLFEDIGKLVWVANTISQASKVVNYVTKKSSVLAIFRSHSSKDLLKPSATRFAYYFIMLSNLLDERCMQGLRKLLIDDRYMQMKVSKTQIANDVHDIVFSSLFWNECKVIVKICTPILKILCLVDREGATMGLIYELTDRMVEQLGSMHDIDQARMKDVMDLCIDRWNMFQTPLHAEGYLLHPIWRGKNQHADLEVNEGWLNYLERYTNGDIVMQGRLIDEFDMYKRGIGMFGRVIAKDETSTPMLQSLALKVLSQGSCASPCERNWSTYPLTHTKRRNRLLP
ncbi:hypothetical protein KP509_21G037200 [Ceratopteris richardii]|uniref:DUF659 domain-containing protein n=1 Tax=Ceratopteris richardii TaxID=49495 RepID=A0A8T2SAZ0_CERRI|nr:hypothetical protein KP509_21G037200 [Ceratopteris richardii]